MQAQRCAFRQNLCVHPAGRLIFVDEFGFHLGMTRRYARADRTERALGSAPCNTDPNLTLVMGLGLRGVVAPMAFTGAMNGAVFESYIEQSLAPELRPGDVVVVDGLGAHRSAKAKQAVESVGAHYRMLPPYSPDLSPVEECGAKVKHAVRSKAPRSVKGVIDAIGDAIGKVTFQDAEGWFRHRAGYAMALY